jgi:hypothetical protein
MKNPTSAVPLRGNITVPHKPGICCNNNCVFKFSYLRGREKVREPEGVVTVVVPF